jgi:putrescine transport system permease protein
MTAGGARGRLAVLVWPFLWLSVFFLVPFGIVARMSLSDTARALPPYAPHWTGFSNLGAFIGGLDLENFGTLAADPLYADALLYSLRVAAIATGFTLAIGFPLAYAITRAGRRWQPVLLVLVILPFWTSFLIRVYAWIGILRPEGLLNGALLWLGLIDQPVRMINTEAAILIGMVYAYLPFMVLPVYASLARLDATLLEAAADLGSPPWKSFWTVTVPLAMPGVIAGSFLVFIPSVGEFVIPDLLGGPDSLMIGRVLWTDFFSNRDWPLSSAVAVVLLIVLVIPIMLFMRLAQRREA